MKIREITNCENELLRSYGFDIRTDDESDNMAWATINIRKTRFAGNWIDTMTIGGVGTKVQYRRGGCIRTFLETVHPRTEKYGACVSILHPFSFSFYRKYGYERIADTLIVDFPITALEFLPRYADLVPMSDDKLADVVALYDRCMAKRNLSFQRLKAEQFANSNGKQMFLYYAADQHLAGYIILQPINHYDGINRMISDSLDVWELVYEDTDALKHLLSFLRMFDGELDTVHLRDIGMSPEVDWVLKRYMHTRYDVHPDIAARILNTEAVLRANTYPTERGVFTLRVEDNLPDAAGTYRVEYENGGCSIERLGDTARVDLTVGPTALAKLLYGTDAFDAELASYLDGVKIENEAKDFFRAFPKRICGLYEHF